MTFDDYILKGYELFGPEGMQIATKFFSGEIDFDTCVKKMHLPVVNYYMQKEINEKIPNKIKFTHEFAAYLERHESAWAEIPSNLPNGAVVGQFTGIPIEIDDTIENEYYELVY
jgi:hypothetical protein